MKISDWVGSWFVRIYKQAMQAMQAVSPKLDLLPNSRTDALRKLLSK